MLHKNYFNNFSYKYTVNITNSQQLLFFLFFFKMLISLSVSSKRILILFSLFCLFCLFGVLNFDERKITDNVDGILVVDRQNKIVCYFWIEFGGWFVVVVGFCLYQKSEEMKKLQRENSKGHHMENGISLLLMPVFNRWQSNGRKWPLSFDETFSKEKFHYFAIEWSFPLLVLF